MERIECAESRRVELAKLELKVTMQAVMELKNEGVDMSMSFKGIEGRKRPKGPNLPVFVDGKDDLDSYLKRFER